MQERRGRYAYFWAEGTMVGYFAIRKHASSDGKWDACIKGTCADAPAMVGEYDDLINDFYWLSV